MQHEEISEEELLERWSHKRAAIQILSNSIHKLRNAVTRDLKSDNEKVFLSALVIRIMDITGERPGNDESAVNGHYGVTGIKKEHVRVDGNKITLEYVGKSGVEHEKSFSNETVAKALKTAIKKSPTKDVFVTSDYFEIKPDRINRILSEYQITNKDLRGYKCNKLVTDKLKDVLSLTPEPIDEVIRKKLFLKILTDVSKKIGHGRATLRTHYLLPEIEEQFIMKGKVVDISEEYKHGGLIPGRRGLLSRIIFGMGK